MQESSLLACLIVKKKHTECVRKVKCKSEKRKSDQRYNRVKRENAKSLTGENRRTLLKRNLQTYAHARCVWHNLSVVQVHESITMLLAAMNFPLCPSSNKIGKLFNRQTLLLIHKNRK